MELENVVKDTVKKYYAMSEDQRNFILDIVDKSETSWTRQQLMKALLLYNKAKEINCSIHDKALDEYVEMIDKNGKRLDFLLNKYDEEYRESVGVIW
jgi:hypothetical protein